MRKRLSRIRHWGHKRDGIVEEWESPDTSDTECSEEFFSAIPSTAASDEPKTDLNEMKDQIEEELKKTSEKEAGMDDLRQELDQERCKNIELEKKLNDILNGRSDASSFVTPKAPPLNDVTTGKVDTYNRAQKLLFHYLGVDFNDFQLHREEETPEPDEQLSARRLTENMRRFKKGLRPITIFLQDLSALSSWYSVYTTAIAFTIYMYATWRGWTISMFLFLAVLRLSLNYLIARGWRIQWCIVPQVSDPVVRRLVVAQWLSHQPFTSVVLGSNPSACKDFPNIIQEPPREELTMSKKFQLVVHVAQRAQNVFGKMADILEKIKNLFMWVEPQLTKKLYVALWVSFIASCLLPYQLCGFIIGVFVGVKFFIINFIFKSCPKLRQRYDTVHIIWTSLPTDIQMTKQVNSSPSRRLLNGVEDGGTIRNYSTKRGTFHKVFNLPESECPLPVCMNGWHCCLLNRDKKTPADYIRNGVLYVTTNYLCFECSRSSSSKRDKVIRLVEIKNIQMYNALSKLPGFGMGISITTPSTQKSMVFGAMANTDEVYNTIVAQRNLAVVMEATSTPET
ncbi:GRAM domain-containing protein 4-like isoform X2 [Stigmatopora nigra]